MYNRCPGQEGRNLQVEVFKCPGCGSDVEVFSDESRFRCKKCGTMVVKKEIDSACIAWCEAAEKRAATIKAKKKPKAEKPAE